MKELEVTAILAAVNRTILCNIKSSQVFTKMVPKIELLQLLQNTHYVFQCQKSNFNGQNLIDYIHKFTYICTYKLWMLSLVLQFPIFLPSDEWSNLIVKLFVPFLLFSINCIRGTIGWGRCSIDNIFYFNTMPASNTTTHYILWGNNIFDIFQNEFKENYMNVPI